jgi:MSHA biogenesis protein MshN
MSLINQMLRDLDARRASTPEQIPLQTTVRATYGRPSRLRPALGLAVAAAAAAGGWYWAAGKPAQVPPVMTPAAVAPQPAAQPQAAVPPVAPAAAVPATASSVTPGASANAASAPVATGGSSVASAPAQPEPAMAPSAKTKTPRMISGAQQGAPQVAKARKAESVGAAAIPQTPATPPSAKPIATTAGEAPSIEKRPRASLASDAAENEYNKAVVALRRGAVADGIVSLQSSLRLDPAHVAARQALLSLMLQQRQWREAQKLAEDGLALNPAQTPWAIALARLQVENGALTEASETLARYEPHATRDAEYQAFHAFTLQKQKRFHEASERYIAAVTLRPGEGRWWYGLGVSLEGDQRPQEAREAFTKARDAGNLPPELAGGLKFHLR